MKQYKVLAIVPYMGLKEILNVVKSEYSELNISVVVENMNYPEKIENIVKNNTYDLIISRGGVLKYIKTLVNIPCIDFKITLYDVVRTIKLLNTFGSKKAMIIGAINLESCGEFIKDYFEKDIPVRTVNSFEETEGVVKRAAEDGYEVVIGDNAAWRCAKENGMPAILLMNGEESVREALDTARDILNCIEKEKVKVDIFKYIITQKKAFWQITDKNDIEIYNNFDAENDKLLLKANELWKENGCMHSFKGYFWNNGVYWEFGVEFKRMMDFELVKMLYVRENGYYGNDIPAAMKISRDGYSDDYTSVLMSGKNETCKKVKELVQYYASFDEPVLLIGKTGTGCAGIAFEMHKRSRKKNELFIEIDCAEMNKNTEKVLFDPKNGRLTQFENGTVFLRKIHLLSYEQQTEIISFFTKTGKNKFRIIASSEMTGETMLNKNILTGKFIKFIGEFEINIPVLSEQKENISALVGLYISSYNMNYGRKIQGIEEKGLNMLSEYTWPGNIDQFNRVMKNILSNVEIDINTTLVKKEWVKEALESSNDSYNRAKLDGFNLDETLEDIEYRIINQILAECDMNQSKAAAKLGISRSTLYRKLNKQ